MFDRQMTHHTQPNDNQMFYGQMTADTQPNGYCVIDRQQTDMCPNDTQSKWLSNV